MPTRRAVVKLIVCGAGLAVVPIPAWPAPIPAATRDALAKEKLIYVATRRKNGDRSTIKPIWFWYDGDALYFTTSPDSWKARRLAKGSPLYIWVGSESGPFVVGEAERITDPEIVARMGEAYSDKYWIAMLGFFRPRPDRVTSGKTIAYKVTLSEGTPAPTPGRP